MSIAKQNLLFGVHEKPTEQKYTAKIETPVYQPRHEKPHIMFLCDDTKVHKLIKEIDSSSVSEHEKSFLRAAAWRHAVFNYEKIADYYAHSSPDAQRLMERSALVIIDFDSAIEQGYVKLCNEIRTQYLEEYTVDE